MLVPLSWLRDFAPFGDDAVALAATFDDLGMVVEGVRHVGEGLDGVVVAHVVGVRPHPGADRVRLADVETGDGEARQVVCGAPNVAAGQLVPLATVGARLPEGMVVSRRKVRGEWSEGMICSEAELGLGNDADGIMVLPEGLSLGVPLVEALGLGPDVVFDLAIEGNRPDAMSVAGVARDAAARLGLPFALGDHPVADAESSTGALATVVVESPDLCPRFTATAVTGVRVGPSPTWVARRLTLAGMRPISNVVDASNYVMLELGQPSHPYDLDLLPGAGLLVRRARAGEALVTLDGTERRMGDDDCLICDAESTPVGIGGIMGGASSEISDATTRVLLEAAYFTPMAIARTSQRLSLRTEASARFERGCDPEGIERSVSRFLSLVPHSAAMGTIDVRTGPPPPAPIRLRAARVNALLGTALGDEELRSYLEPIGFRVEARGGGELEVVPPTFRPDVTGEIDLVEEVARHHGYRNVARTVPSSPYVGHLTPYQRGRRRLKEVLVGAGVHEAVTPPLVGPDDHGRAGLAGEVITAVDPLAREESVLRTSLLPGLLKAIAFNVGHRNPDVAFFEVGHVFTVPAERTAELPDERELVAVALAGEGAGAVTAKRVLDTVLDGLGRSREAAVVAATAPGLHPTRTARVEVGGRPAGYVGEVDPEVVAVHGIEGRVGWIEVDLDVLLPKARAYPQAVPLSRLPSSDIDLAFVVDDATPAGAVEATLREAGGDLLVDLRLFDVYRGPGLAEGRRSLAYRLRLQAMDHTLTDAEIAAVRQRCIEAVEAAHPAELRA